MSEFTKADYLTLKWRFAALAISVLTGVLLWAGLSSLEAAATRDLNVARSDMDRAQNQLDQIEEEEALIKAYIGRYQQLSERGIVGTPDRLQFQEYFAELQSEYNLFPIALNILEQTALPLTYPPTAREPGRPIELRGSRVEFSLPLLHENDLGLLLAGLLKKPELLQVDSCELNASTTDRQALLRLGQHFTALCSLYWYTFSIVEAGDPAQVLQ